MVVKIANFGMTHDIYGRDFYEIEDLKEPMPVRWMAPECFDSYKFDSRSDVVSYIVETN